MSALIVRSAGDQVVLSRVHPGSRAKVIGLFEDVEAALDEAEAITLNKVRDEFAITEVKVLEDRKCLTCSRVIASEGPHHRRCDVCRQMPEGLV